MTENPQNPCTPISNNDLQTDAPKKIPVEDDRYPGSFFKVPSAPISAKTAWRIS